MSGVFFFGQNWGVVHLLIYSSVDDSSLIPDHVFFQSNALAVSDGVAVVFFVSLTKSIDVFLTFGSLSSD